MKKAVLFFHLLILVSCGTKNTSGAQDDNLDGAFILTKVGDKQLTTEKYILEFDAEKNTVFGYTGCNGFSADYTKEKNDISFTGPVSTRKFCKEKMETERLIQRTIGEIAKLRKDGETYMFYSKDNTPLMTLIKKEDSE